MVSEEGWYNRQAQTEGTDMVTERETYGQKETEGERDRGSKTATEKERER